VGSGALSNILYYVRAVPHGRKWEDGKMGRGRASDDVGRLHLLEIARYLQRSQASVAGKAAKLHLVIETPRPKEPIEIPPFGLVRDKGEFVRPALTHAQNR